MINKKYMNSLSTRIAAGIAAACAVSVMGTACMGAGAKIGTSTVSEETTEAQTVEAEAEDTSKSESSKGEISIKADGTEVEVSGTNSDSVKVEGTTITITKQGTYRLSGTLSEGQILVEAGDKDDVRLIFDGFNISNSETAPISVVTSGDFTIELMEGTDNAVLDKRAAIVQEETGGTADTTETSSTDTEIPDAAIYSKSDLIILGTGTLTVEGGYCDGIHGKDTVLISEDVTLDITAAEHGINGKDSLEIQAGSYEIKSGEDALHSKGDVTVSDGTFAITASDDGIHAENNLTINGGVINITESYEGLEALAITINGGDISLKSSDDGINAAGGADSSGGAFEATDGAAITINGGKLLVIVTGDGLDSNGDLIVNGGEVYIDGPEMGGNGSLDYTGNASISGGTVALTGASGMFQSFSEDSTQPQIVVYYSEQQEAGTAITVSDSEGNVIYENDDSTQNFTVFLYSSAELKEGEAYTVKTGDQEETVTIDGITNTIGEASGDMMMGGRGQGGFGMRGGQGGPGRGDAQGAPEMNGEQSAPDMSQSEDTSGMSGTQGESGMYDAAGRGVHGGPEMGGRGQGGRPQDMGQNGMPMDPQTETQAAS